MSASTNSSLSISSAEFVWDHADETHAHRYLAPPAIRALRSFGVSNVLDLGCGNGAFSARLWKEGFAVKRCDVSESGLALARKAHPEIEVFRHNVANDLPDNCRGAYDAVVSLEVIEHLPFPRCLLKAAWQALRPGGVLVVSTPYHGYVKNLAIALVNGFDKHWHPLRDCGHVKFFSLNTLSLLMKEAGFDVSRIARVGRIPALACSMLAIAVKSEAQEIK
jgi:2-polyprenyl-6-hydroxyphenyl methylase/3-demethylubiquinone-9 3-methyltransferase